MAYDANVSAFHFTVQPGQKQVSINFPYDSDDDEATAFSAVADDLVKQCKVKGLEGLQITNLRGQSVNLRTAVQKTLKHKPLKVSEVSDSQLKLQVMVVEEQPPQKAKPRKGGSTGQRKGGTAGSRASSAQPAAAAADALSAEAADCLGKITNPTAFLNAVWPMWPRVTEMRLEFVIGEDGQPELDSIGQKVVDYEKSEFKGQCITVRHPGNWRLLNEAFCSILCHVFGMTEEEAYKKVQKRATQQALSVRNHWQKVAAATAGATAALLKAAQAGLSEDQIAERMGEAAQTEALAAVPSTASCRKDCKSAEAEADAWAKEFKPLYDQRLTAKPRLPLRLLPFCQLADREAKRRAAEKASGGKQQCSPDAAAETAVELDAVHDSAANEEGSAAEDAADAAAAKAAKLRAPPAGTLVAAYFGNQAPAQPAAARQQESADGSTQPPAVSPLAAGPTPSSVRGGVRAGAAPVTAAAAAARGSDASEAAGDLDLDDILDNHFAALQQQQQLEEEDLAAPDTTGSSKQQQRRGQQQQAPAGGAAVSEQQLQQFGHAASMSASFVGQVGSLPAGSTLPSSHAGTRAAARKYRPADVHPRAAAAAGSAGSSGATAGAAAPATAGSAGSSAEEVTPGKQAFSQLQSLLSSYGVSPGQIQRLKIAKDSVLDAVKAGVAPTAGDLRKDAEDGLLPYLPTAIARQAAKQGKDLDTDRAAAKRSDAAANKGSQGKGSSRGRSSNTGKGGDKPAAKRKQQSGSSKQQQKRRKKVAHLDDEEGEEDAAATSLSSEEEEADTGSSSDIDDNDDIVGAAAAGAGGSGRRRSGRTTAGQHSRWQSDDQDN